MHTSAHASHHAGWVRRVRQHRVQCAQRVLHDPWRNCPIQRTSTKPQVWPTFDILCPASNNTYFTRKKGSGLQQQDLKCLASPHTLSLPDPLPSPRRKRATVRFMGDITPTVCWHVARLCLDLTFKCLVFPAVHVNLILTICFFYRRSKSCKKDLWQRIVNALSTGNIWCWFRLRQLLISMCSCGSFSSWKEKDCACYEQFMRQFQMVSYDSQRTGLWPCCCSHVSNCPCWREQDCNGIKDRTFTPQQKHKCVLWHETDS